MENLYLSKEVVEHPLNSELNLEQGEASLSGECVGEKPQVPPHEVGYYLCVGGKWVFFPGSMEN